MEKSLLIAAVCICLVACQKSPTATPAAAASSAASAAAAASSPSTQARLGSLVQAIQLPKGIDFPAPAGLPDLQELASQEFKFSTEGNEAAWTRILADARTRANGPEVKSPIATRVRSLASAGKVSEARHVAASAASPIKEALLAFLDVRYGTADPETAWTPIADAAPELSANEMYYLITGLSFRYGARGAPLLARYVLDAGRNEQSRQWVASDVVTWPATPPQSGPDADVRSYVSQDTKIGDGKRTLQQLLFDTALAVWEKLDAQASAAEPLVKEEFETSEAFQARQASAQARATAEAEAAKVEWRYRFARGFANELVRQGQWKLTQLSYNADLQQFSGTLEVNGATQIPVRFPTPLADAPDMKKSMEHGVVEPTFAIRNSGELVLSSLLLSGASRWTRVDLQSSLGMSVAADAMKLPRQLTAELAEERRRVEAAARARVEKEEAAERARVAEASTKNAQRPEVRACLERVQSRFGTVSSGINAAAIVQQAQAVRACHDLPSGGNASNGVAPQEQAGNFVPAGKVICGTQRDAIQYTMIVRRISNAPLPGSCQYVGADVRVQVLQTAQMGQATVALVGNQGGTAWVAHDEIR